MVTVEFVLISFPLFLLLLCMADFGDAFFMRQAITEGARYGARYGAVYQWKTEAQVQTIVTNFLTGIGITPGPITAPLPVGAQTGDPRTVTVTATKTWWVLDFILLPTPITATSTMRLE